MEITAMSLTNEVRISETERELNSLCKQISGWLKGWRERDERQQYHSQLNTLDTFLTRILEGLRVDLEGINSNSNSGDVFAACQEVDRRLVWLRRSWRFYADKFDQRDDNDLKAVLKAADEVVWSCFAEVFEHGAKERRAAPPLPYIEPTYSPLAVPRDDPRILKDPKISGDFFRDYLVQLPIPLVGLPPTCLESPWWLIFLGHEVGHHVQSDLMPDHQLESQFASWLGEQGGERWSLWGQEIFADTFSILTMGVQALWAMTELEMAPAAEMLVEKRSNKAYYPPPVVRLRLMAELATELEQDGGWGLRNLVPAGKLTAPEQEETQKLKKRRQAVNALLERVESLAIALRNYSPAGLGRLDDLCGWKIGNFSAFGSVTRWRNHLRGLAAHDPGPSLEAPRLIVSGAVAAWAQITALEDKGQRKAARDVLQENLPTLVVANQQEGKRAARKPPALTDAGALADEVAQLLRDKSAEELGI
jgi:transposase-like protein